MRKILVCACLAGGALFTAVGVAETGDPLESPARQSARTGKSVLLAVARADARLVAVGERGIVLLSDDHGVSWRQAKVPASVALTNVRFFNGRMGWIVGHGGLVLHTADGGETWVKQFDGRQAAAVELDAAKAVSSDGPGARRRLAEAEGWVADGPDKPLLDIHFFDDRRGLAVGAYGLVFGTRDGGKTWQSLKDRIDNPKGKHLYGIHAAGADVLLFGEQGALYRSRDAGERFVEVQTPYTGTYFGAFAVDPDTLIVFGLRGNVHRSADNGAAWRKVDVGMPVTLSAGARLGDGTLVLADESGRVLRSGDAGNSFIPIPVPQPAPFVGVVEAADGGLILAGARGITRLPAAAISREPKK